jgi:HEAT repeat protein
MRIRIKFAILLGLLACVGCSGEKSTDELVADVQAGKEKERIIAARLLPKRDAGHAVPALIAALKDKEGDVRWSAAIGLGYFGEEAKEAIPALKPLLRDRDARIREAARVAISRIDPSQTPAVAAAKAAR